MKKFFKFIGFFVLGLIALGVAIAVMSDGSNKSTNNDALTTSEQTTTTPAEPPMVVNAKDLVAAYENNEVAADQKYKGKTLEVSGKVAGIDSGIGDKAVVRLVGTNEFASAMADGDDEFTKYAATLSKGQDITLICVGAGEVIGSPMLNQCKAK